MKTDTPTPSVAQELKRRNGCRYGLGGVTVALDGEPDRRFVIQSSSWSARGGLQVAIIPEERYEEYKRDRAARPQVMSAAELLTYRDPDYLRHDVPAEQCRLLSEWPVVCRCWCDDEEECLG